MTIDPVLMPVGPMMIGTMTCTVCPPLSVVVCVMVVLTVLVRFSSSSPPVVLVCSVATVVDGNSMRLVVEEGA